MRPILSKKTNSNTIGIIDSVNVSSIAHLVICLFSHYRQKNSPGGNLICWQLPSPGKSDSRRVIRVVRMFSTPTTRASARKIGSNRSIIKNGFIQKRFLLFLSKPEKPKLVARFSLSRFSIEKKGAKIKRRLDH